MHALAFQDLTVGSIRHNHPSSWPSFWLQTKAPFSTVRDPTICIRKYTNRSAISKCPCIMQLQWKEPSALTRRIHVHMASCLKAYTMQLLASVCPHSCSAWHLHTSTEFPYNSIVCFTSCLTIHVSFKAIVGVQDSVYMHSLKPGQHAWRQWILAYAKMEEKNRPMLQKLLESVDSFYEARDRDGKLVSGTDVM